MPGYNLYLNIYPYLYLMHVYCLTPYINFYLEVNSNKNLNF